MQDELAMSNRQKNLNNFLYRLLKIFYFHNLQLLFQCRSRHADVSICLICHNLKHCFRNNNSFLRNFLDNSSGVSDLISIFKTITFLPGFCDRT